MPIAIEKNSIGEYVLYYNNNIKFINHFFVRLILSVFQSISLLIRLDNFEILSLRIYAAAKDIICEH